jgi:hypothetical protein
MSFEGHNLTGSGGEWTQEAVSVEIGETGYTINH